MAEYTFYTNPMSRGQIARWALHEAGADYEQVLVDWAAKGDLLKVNPMGKVPTIVHHHGGHDHVVTEAAAICHYLAEMSAPGLLPRGAAIRAMVAQLEGSYAYTNGKGASFSADIMLRSRTGTVITPKQTARG